MERSARVESSKCFFGWHKVEIFGDPTGVLGEVYVAVTNTVELDTYSLLNIPSPTALSYFHNRTLSGDTARAQDVCSIARGERAMAVLMLYLAACRDGVRKRRPNHPRIQHSCFGVIVCGNWVTIVRRVLSLTVQW